MEREVASESMNERNGDMVDATTGDRRDPEQRKRIKIREPVCPSDDCCTRRVPRIGGADDQQLYEEMLEAADFGERKALIDCWYDVLGRDGEPAEFLAAVRRGKTAVLELGESVAGEDESRRCALYQALASLGEGAEGEDGDEGGDGWWNGAARLEEAAIILQRPEGAEAYRLMCAHEREAVRTAIEKGWLWDALELPPDEGDIVNREVFGDVTPWECGILDDAVIALRDYAHLVQIVASRETPGAVRECLLALADVHLEVGWESASGNEVTPDRLVAALDARTAVAWDHRLYPLHNDLTCLAAQIGRGSGAGAPGAGGQAGPRDADEAGEADKKKALCAKAIQAIEEVMKLGRTKCRIR